MIPDSAIIQEFQSSKLDAKVLDFADESAVIKFFQDAHVKLMQVKS